MTGNCNKCKSEFHWTPDSKCPNCGADEKDIEVYNELGD